MWHALGNNWPLGQENLFVQKNTSKWAILVCTNLGYQTSEGPGRQMIDTRSTPGVPLKNLGIWRLKLAIWEVGGIIIERTRARYFFRWDTEISEKWFFCKTLHIPKFSTGKIFGANTYGILTHSGFRKCIWKVVTTNFWPCFACPKLGDSGEMRVASKNRVVLEKAQRSQFWL